MKVTVEIWFKEGVLDPQGKAVAHALASLGFQGVSEVRVGKLIELEIETPPGRDVHADLSAMCEQLLANTVIEQYVIHLPPMP